jgi:hypothetical protein
MVENSPTTVKPPPSGRLSWGSGGGDSGVPWVEHLSNTTTVRAINYAVDVVSVDCIAMSRCEICSGEPVHKDGAEGNDGRGKLSIATAATTTDYNASRLSARLVSIRQLGWYQSVGIPDELPFFSR